MTNRLTIAVAQLNAHVGDIDRNTNIAIETLRAHPKDDLVVFPECFITGYPLEDLVLRPSFIAATERAIARLTDEIIALNGPAVLIGAPIAGPDLPYNAALFIKPDGTKTVATKIDRPNDGVFDEIRTFAKGAPREPIAWKGVRIGVGICEEMWRPDVSRDLAGRLADLLIFINGSPYARGKHRDQRLAHARARVRETGLPLLYANLVGGQDEIVLDGASFLIDANQEILMQAPAFQESTQVITFPMANHVIAAYPDDDEADYTACVLGLRDYVAKCGRKDVVLGMSGGIDSALAGAIAVDALGPDSVRAITMPSQVTSQDNLDDAGLACAALGIPCHTLPIENPVAAVIDAFEAAFNQSISGIARENVQARIRMIMNMLASNQFGPMLITTGNKSEMSVGYATLYGDMSGGFNPIKDLYKTEVWRLSRWRNTNSCSIGLGPEKPIPSHIISKTPTAELEEGQTDEASLGPYPVLDALLVAMIDDDLDATAAYNRVKHNPPADHRPKHARVGDVASFLTLEHAEKIAGLIKHAEWKRRQASPGVKIGPRAFGRDRRYPIANGFTF
jgi:NAD+ synthase